MNIDNRNNRRRDAVLAAFAITIAVVVMLTGCATAWIDKVYQARATSAKIGYRTVAEFNAYYSVKTNHLNGTTPDLEAARSLVYDASKDLSRSLLVLEDVETAYRLAPTNQMPVINALNAVTANASNIINTVNYLTK